MLIKTSATTHSFNVDQRIYEMDFAISGSTLTASMPTNPNEATPGHYMLFLIDSAGTPSVADIVRLAAAEPLAGPPPAANLVSDGDFEALPIASTAWKDYPNPPFIGPWLVTSGKVSLHGATHRNLASGTGAPGGQHLDLDAGPGGGTVTQTINGLTPGTSYNLTFSHALHDLANGNGTANVSIANLNTNFTSTTTGSTAWTEVLYNVTATNATHTLSFTELTSAGNQMTGVLIDGITLTAAP